MLFTPGINVIRGVNEASKTTRLEAIAYALFGTSALRTSLDEAVTWGFEAKTLKVGLTLDAGGKCYTYSRSKAGAEVMLEGAVFCTGQKEVSALSAHLLGADAATATKLMFASQGAIRGALESGAKALSLLIEDLAGFSAFDNVLEAATEKLVSGSPLVLEERLQGALLNLESSLQDRGEEPDRAAYDLNIAEIEEAEYGLDEDIAGYTMALQIAESKHREASISYLKRQTLEGVVEMCQRIFSFQGGNLQALPEASVPNYALVTTLQLELAEAETFVKRSEAYELFRFLPVGTVFNGSLQAFSQKTSDQAELKQETAIAVKVLENEIKTAQASRINYDTCSKCGQDVSQLPIVQETNAKADAALHFLGIKLQETQVSLTSISRHVGRLAEIQTYAHRVQPTLDKIRDFISQDETYYPAKPCWVGLIPETIPDVREINASLRLAETNVKASEANRAKREGLNEQVQVARDSLKKAEKALASFTGSDGLEVEALKAKQDRLGQHLKDFKAEKAELGQLREIEERRLRDLETLWDNMNKRIAYANQAIETCEKDLGTLRYNNALIKKLRAVRPLVANKVWGVTLNATSSMFSQIRGEQSTVTKDTSGFKVNGQPIESLSGSTLDALGLALRVTLTRTFLPNCNLLLLDEVAAGMDTERTEKMLGFLQSIGLGQILLVTHEEISSSIADNLLEI
jgi:DNA repair exonuclease SbcCD ATPase subunit